MSNKLPFAIFAFALIALQGQIHAGQKKKIEATKSENSSKTAHKIAMVAVQVDEKTYLDFEQDLTFKELLRQTAQDSGTIITGMQKETVPLKNKCNYYLLLDLGHEIHPKKLLDNFKTVPGIKNAILKDAFLRLQKQAKN